MPVVLRRMSAAEYDAWRVHSVLDYAQSFVDAGILTPDDARQRAEDDYARLLPDGRDTPDHVVMSAVVGEERVGVLWVNFVERAGGLEGFVYDVEVIPEQRGKGYGRAIMEACHDLCRERG